MNLFRKACVAVLPVLFAAHAQAASITTSALPFAPASYTSMAVDPVTGKVYQTTTYSGSSILAYANTNRYDSRASNGSVAVTNFGPYLAAYDGSLYLRTGGTSSTVISKVSATTGAIQKSVGVTGGMSSETFNWGGWSAVNPMSDGSKLYVVGGVAANNQWSIATFDYALNQTKTVSFDLLNSTAGYAFAVNGYVFFGDGYNSAHISRRVDAATGAVQVVDFTLAGLQQNPYITGISYDSLHDSLYVANYGGVLSKATGIAAQLGVQRSAVPEPASMALFGLGLAALAMARRRQGAASK
jgi:autoaggregation protein RapA/B/C